MKQEENVEQKEREKQEDEEMKEQEEKEKQNERYTGGEARRRYERVGREGGAEKMQKGLETRRRENGRVGGDVGSEGKKEEEEYK